MEGPSIDRQRLTIVEHDLHELAAALTRLRGAVAHAQTAVERVHADRERLERRLLRTGRKQNG